MKKKLAIISSYGELCGNATYTYVLEQEFLKYYDVEVISLNVKLLQSENKSEKNLADRHILDIENKIKDYDFVNIQFEVGLFGLNKRAVLRRFSKLIKGSKTVIVTMHRLDMRRDFFTIKTLKEIRTMSFFSLLKQYRNERYYALLYEKVVRIIKKASKSKNASILVHTKREKYNISAILKFDKVYDHPITFLTQDQRKLFSKDAKSIFRAKYKIEDNEVVVGIFGFISSYKSHHTAISALKYLPNNYKLMIFGSQHPHSITQGIDIEPYTKSLLDLIDSDRQKTIKDVTYELSERVIFVGSLDDQNFIADLHGVDFTILPYVETNQSGSGIAALTLESKTKAIFSNNLAFLELQRYAKKSFKTADIGNSKEMADAIQNYNFDEYSQNLDTYLSTYNIESNIELHREIFEKRHSC
ncbi:hypothetical protein OAT39_00865 [Candidatus Thioglobus sp.]|nr:hypothetical protein [Candidatus Thioglobus sp.]